jgi:hypothetical protein
MIERVISPDEYDQGRFRFLPMDLVYVSHKYIGDAATGWAEQAEAFLALC